MRTIVDLTDAQIEALAKLGEAQNLSRAALVRKAIDEFVKNHSTEGAEEAFGLWRERGIDGLSYQQALRDEWE